MTEVPSDHTRASIVSGQLASDAARTAQPGQLRLAWRRFRRHRLAMIGAAVLLLVAALALVGPAISPVAPAATDFYHGNLPPTTEIGANLLQRNVAPQLWPFDWRLLMGTDSWGVPILAYTLYGFQPALEIGILASLLASIVGIVLGGIAGYFGRLVDTPIMRLADAFLAVPAVPLIMLVSAFLSDKSIAVYVALFAATGWPGVARLARGAVSSLREREFAAAARSLGVSDLGVLFRHILPNASSVLIVAFTLNAALFVVAEASLDFLGAGPAAVTWGGALASAYYSLGLATGYWWQWIFPAAGLLLTVMALNFVGDGLSDALDVSRWTVVVGEAVLEEEAETRTGPWWRRGLGAAGWRIGRVLGPASTGMTHLHQDSSGPCRRAGPRSEAERCPASPAWPGGRPLLRVPAPRLTPERRATEWIAGRTTIRAGSEAITGLLRGLDALPGAMMVIPIVVVLLAVEAVFLLGHSPLDYAPNFSAPMSFGSVSAQSDYTAFPRQAGGWNLLATDGRSDLAYERYSGRGRLLYRKVVARGDYGAEPSMAESRGRTFGVWVAMDGQLVRLRAGYFGATDRRSFPLTAGHSDVGHPDAVALSNGGFDVVFQRDVQGHISLYLAAIAPGAHHRTLYRRLTHDPYGDLVPHAAADGDGALDVLYLEHCCGTSVWRVVAARFSPSGWPLGRPRVLDTVHYAPQNRIGRTLYNAIPPQWGLDLKRARDGSVWAAWSDDQFVSVARFGIQGGFVLRRHSIAPTGSQLELALALMPHGGELFTASHPNEGSYIAAIHFGTGGKSSGIGQRVNFDPHDEAYDPEAGTVDGRPVLVWQNVRPGGIALIEETGYHRPLPPDLATRLGLNMGNVWENAVLILFGSLVGGVVLAVVNALLIALLILIWLPVGRLPWRRLRWPAYFALASLALALVFAVNASAPIVLVMTSLVAPLEAAYRWLAVAGAIVVALCVSTLLRHLEPLLRAAGTALAAVWFIAALYAALAIQFAITRV